MPLGFDGYRPGAPGAVLGLHMDYYAGQPGFTLSVQSDADQWQGGVREQLFRRPAPEGVSGGSLQP